MSTLYNRVIELLGFAAPVSSTLLLLLSFSLAKEVSRYKLRDLANRGEEGKGTKGAPVALLRIFLSTAVFPQD